MKNILYVVIIMFIIQSCVEGSSGFNVTRVIKNNTVYDVVLQVYVETTVMEEYFIEAKDSLVSTSICGQEAGHIFCDLIWTFEGRDSVSVIFDTKKVLNYCGFDETCYYQNDKTIMYFNLFRDNTDGYEEVSDKVYVFTITEEDYQLAEELGG